MLRLCPIAVASFTLAVLIAPPPAHAASTKSLAVRTGQSMIVSTPGLRRVAVGDGRIAGVVPIGGTEIVVNGKTTGRTTIIVWGGGSPQTYDVTVIDASLEDLRAMLQSQLGADDVRVETVDRSVVIGGSVATGERLVQVGDIAARFAPVAQANKVSILNAVTVAQPLGPLQSELAAAPQTSGVRVDRDAKGNLIVSGGVPDRVTAEHVLARVRALAGPYLAIDGKVVDRLESATVSQVSVKVYILEVDDTALRQLGIDLQSATFRPDGTYTLGGPQFPVVEGPYGKPPVGIPGRGLNVGGFFRTITLAPTINLVVNNGHARLLSSPDLVTLPGRQADFLVGGQIPVPYSNGPQTVAIVYKDFGVKLQVTPTILGGGGVETVIAPEVSDLDFQDGVTLNGFVVPALKTSRLSTDVITKAGESIVLGGLLRRQEQRFIDKIPGLGDLPVLGKLFRSTRYQNAQTDVVFVMTPEILTR